MGVRVARVVAEDVLQHLAGELRSFKNLLHCLQSPLLALKLDPCIIRDQANAAAVGSEAAVGIVDPQMQSELGARGEHAVGLVRALRDQVVNQDRGVGFRPVEDKRRLALHFESSVNPSHYSLTRSLFIARRTVDLSGEKEA